MSQHPLSPDSTSGYPAPDQASSALPTKAGRCIECNSAAARVGQLCQHCNTKLTRIGREAVRGLKAHRRRMKRDRKNYLIVDPRRSFVSYGGYCSCCDGVEPKMIWAGELAAQYRGETKPKPVVSNWGMH